MMSEIERLDIDNTITSMDFETAEKIISGSMNMGYPALGVVGRNQIGKSSMLSELTKIYSPKVEFWKEFDMGGFQNWLKNTQQSSQVKTIVVSGIENILKRKYEIVRSSIGTIADMIDDVQGKSVNFQFGNKPMLTTARNFIIGMTPYDLRQLAKWGYTHFLARMAFLHVERPPIDGNQEFQLEYIPNPGLHIELLEYQDKHASVRHFKILRAIKSQLTAIGFTGQVSVGLFVIPERGKPYEKEYVIDLSHNHDLRWKQWYHVVVRGNNRV